MPANVGHILMANKALNNLARENPTIHSLISSKVNHYYLGALGPDLPSYKTSRLVREALVQLLVRPLVSHQNPQEEDASFLLHSTRPNLFPFYLMETNLSYADLKAGALVTNEFNRAVLAFAMGYVTHIAADQIIHKLVRQIVGPYYRSLEVSKRHSECEVNQDIFLFYELYPDRTFDKTIQKDLIDTGKFQLFEEQFCNMISLTVSKAGYRRVCKEDIEGWLEGIKTAFELMDQIGPYEVALDNFQTHRKDLAQFPLYRTYFRDPGTHFDYLTCFNRAVKLSGQYLAEIARLWMNPDFSYNSFVQFQQTIQPDDLTSPYRDL